MDAIHLMVRFQDLERNQRLFEQRVEGELWWDSVRYDVHTFITKILLGRGTEVRQSPPQWRHFAAQALGTALRARLYEDIRRKRDRIVLLRAPRHRTEGVSKDTIVDPIAELFKNETYAIDTLPRRYHVPCYQYSKRSGSVPEDLQKKISTILETFGIPQERSGELEAIIRFRRFVFEEELRGYDRLLNYARPRLIVLVQNGIEKSLFKVAHAQRVPTVELQHGLIGYTHPAYSYPNQIDYAEQRTFPDLFLSFSDFWGRSFFYPEAKQVPVGNDQYFVRPITKKCTSNAMFVSSAVHHLVLAKWVRRIAELSPNRKIMYKLHPGQHSFFKQISSEFSDLPNVDVVSAQIPASILLEQVTHVVGICSTVIYEALQAGRAVCIIPEQDYLAHADLLHMPGVSLTSTPEELDRALETPSNCIEPPRFFEPFDAELARSTLRDAMQKKAERNQSVS